MKIKIYTVDYEVTEPDRTFHKYISEDRRIPNRERIFGHHPDNMHGYVSKLL